MLGLKVISIIKNNENSEDLSNTLIQAPRVIALIKSCVAEHDDAEDYTLNECRLIIANFRKYLKHNPVG